MTTLAGVGRFLSSESAWLPSWVHYLPADLAIARWAVLDGADRGMPRLLTLAVTLVFLALGPTGLLMYLALKVFWPGQPSAPKTD